MTESQPLWSGSPEKRIIRELRETRVGGLEPGNDTVEFGRVFESVLARELQMLARERSNVDLRFARGYVVEDYGNPETGEVSLVDDDSVTKDGPRFDIVCYHGNVAWSTFERFPAAVVPKSLVNGVIEAKRTISPKRFGPDSNEHYNEQLRNQRDYLDDLGADIPRVVVGAHFFGTPEENRRKALADSVVGLGDLNKKSSATKMACDGELASVIDQLAGDEPFESVDEKTKNLQKIAADLTDDESDGQ